MKRRDFLKYGAMTGGLLAFSQLSFAKGLNNAQSEFTLNILTDKPNLAIPRVTELIKAMTSQPVSYTESIMSGEYISDIAYVLNNKLIDYNYENAGIAKSLKGLAKELKMQTKVIDPVLVTFSSARNSAKPEKVNILQNNILVNQLQLSDNVKEFSIPNGKGEIVLIVNNGRVSVLHSSCNHKTCMKSGSIANSGESIICIPNSTRISVVGKNRFGVDSIVY